MADCTRNAPGQTVIAALQDFLNKREDGDLYLTHHSMDTSKMELVEMIEGLMGNAPDGGEVESVAWRAMASAPKDGTSFMAAQDEWVYRCQWLEEEPDEGPPREGWFDLENLSFEAPTHWMPLPAAPGTAPSGTAEVEPVAISGRQVDAALEKLEEIRNLQLTRSVMLQVLQAGAIAPPAPTASPDAELVKTLRSALQYARNLLGPDEIIDAALSKHGGNDA